MPTTSTFPGASRSAIPSNCCKPSRRADGKQDLLYVALSIGNSKREFFRFVSTDDSVDFFDADGQTGKRFLNRRPLQSGGDRICSRFGYRKHPIFGTYKLHTGVDLSRLLRDADLCRRRRRGREGAVGIRLRSLRHDPPRQWLRDRLRPHERIADGIEPGVRVRQGQIIGYVGSTGVSTGNHLHFEIKINGRFVDPLSVKLPRDKSLPASDQREFDQTIAQIRDLMARDPAPVTVASTASSLTGG